MGVFGLWVFLKDKGVEPVFRSFSRLPNLLESLEDLPAIRVDVLGCCFMTIRHAYESHPDEIAHGILEGEIAKFGPKELLVLYIDGEPAVEKSLTTAIREERRKNSLEVAERHMDELERRHNASLRVRKHHFVNVTKNLSGAFYWSREKRQGFSQYMRDKNWNVVESPTEADLHIARDCQRIDVVVSRDSDLLIYQNVATVWRPISKGRFLVYGIDNILATLKITRTQLMVLGVVSRNDYNKNIRGLGPATNFSIVKRLCGEDPAAMVQAYLDNEQVILKNSNQETFSNSIKVFINGTQTPMLPLPTIQTNQDRPTINSVKARFGGLCQQRKNIRQGLQPRSSGHKQSKDTPIQRHGAGQKFNCYRNIDTPPPKDKQRDSPLPKDQPSPQHRPCYSIKVRTRRKVHEPPRGMKQYKLKAWTALPPSPQSPDPTTNPSPTPKKKRKISKKPRKAIVDMNKRDLLYNLAAEHPMTRVLDSQQQPNGNASKSLAFTSSTLKTMVPHLLTEVHWTISAHDSNPKIRFQLQTKKNMTRLPILRKSQLNPASANRFWERFYVSYTLETTQHLEGLDWQWTHSFSTWKIWGF
ncbi:hypothetical protein BGZ82_005074 [Podila clonocystis]|nr:hypothetical protein BGZ82_005074 [Podila clonocystis]